MQGRDIILGNQTWRLQETQLILHLSHFPISYISFFRIFLQYFFYFLHVLFSWTRHGNVGHITWYRVRNIPAQLCYAPNDSQLRLGVDASTVPIHPGLLNLFFPFSMFSCFCKLSFSTSWNSTLKSFENEVIQERCLVSLPPPPLPLSVKQGNSPFPCHFLFHTAGIDSCPDSSHLYVIVLTITCMVQAPNFFCYLLRATSMPRGIFVYQLRIFHLFCSLICLLQRLCDVFQSKYSTTFLFARPFNTFICYGYSQWICLLQKPVYLEFKVLKNDVIAIYPINPSVNFILFCTIYCVGRGYITICCSLNISAFSNNQTTYVLTIFI